MKPPQPEGEIPGQAILYTTPTHPSCPLRTGAFPASADNQIRKRQSQVKMAMHKNISHFTETHPILATSATPVSPQWMTVTTSLIFEVHILLFANKFALGRTATYHSLWKCIPIYLDNNRKMKKVGAAEGTLQSSAQMGRALMLGSSAQKTLPANKPRSAVTCPM